MLKNLNFNTFLSKIKERKLYYLFLFFSGLFFAFSVHHWGYQLFTDPKIYSYVDDGMITYSHAKNLYEYGFIGVSPSGGIVEGYSTPFLFINHVIAYGLGISYQQYTDFQTYISLFFLGCLFFYISEGISFWARGVLVGFSVFIFCNSQIFLEWHGSGMENALTNLFIPWAIVVLYNYIKTNKVTIVGIIVVGLASITRVDSLYYIVPLLFISLLFVYKQGNSTFKNIGIDGVKFMSIPIFSLVTRYIYFSHIFPDSSRAQEISIGKQLYLLFTLDTSYIKSSMNLLQSIFYVNAAYLIIPALVLFAFVKLSDNENAFIFLLLIATVLIFFHPFIFHASRLDPSRYGSQVLPIAIMVVIIAAKQIFVWSYDLKKILIIPAFVMTSLVTFKQLSHEPYYICCNMDWIDAFTARFKGWADENRIYRATISNPDLGIVSYKKWYNIVDLGCLGSPDLGLINTNRALQGFYLGQLRRPDFIQAHSEWAQMYRHFLNHPDFFNYYKPNEVNYSQVSKDRLQGAPEMIYASAREIIDVNNPVKKFDLSLQDNLKNPDVLLKLINEQVALVLNKQNYKPSDWAYISRQVFRYVPEFRKLNILDKVVETLSKIDDNGYHKTLFYSYKNSRWDENMFEITKQLWLKEYFQTTDFNNALKDNAIKIFDANDYQLYISKNNGAGIIFSKKKLDEDANIFVRFMPKQERLIPAPWVITDKYEYNMNAIKEAYFGEHDGLYVYSFYYTTHDIMDIKVALSTKDGEVINIQHSNYLINPQDSLSYNLLNNHTETGNHKTNYYSDDSFNGYLEVNASTDKYALYGPYIRMKAGNYKIKLNYLADDYTDKFYADIFSSEKGIIAQNDGFKPAQLGDKKWQIVYNVSLKEDVENFEFRVKYKGEKMASLEKVTIIRQ
ncbi:hypothetical protein SAMN05421780_103203 [Flexibacter flexilis DSM 6793]|uniref:Uncharacterized protein n=1 Tax=Flexibacter flexilis DSM 6793 TaxID=927664 RepID=A0A1I1H582_9BACT|nr:hypothetical protein [Flexibacter flexilis]SFC18722.1 hypothetical protein SAMN05421780_103203 [Flexibacter flexilis DSM 6793]